MQAKKFIMILICLAFSTNMFPQKGYVGKINQLNSNGQKEGLWVDSTKYRIYESYYKNGILSGTYKKYNTKGRLLIFGEYKDGQMSGTWFFFENTGHLMMVFKDFDKNTDSVIREADGKSYVPDYKCYCITYYTNGNIESEGVLLWSEGDEPESDTSVEYGLWKYYDETGKLIKTKFFQ